MRPARLVVALFIVALAVGGYYGITSRQQEAKPATGPAKGGPVPVVVARAETRDVAVRLALIGRAEPYASVTVQSRVDGQVVAVAFADGQTVAQGEVLLRLDPADFEARLRQAEANLARDQAELARAQADLTRYTASKTREFVSEEQLAQVRAVATAAAATVRADEAAVALARLQLDYTTLRAPFAGRVGSRLVHPGALIKANDTALAVLNQVHPLYVTFAVPERYLPRLRAGLAEKRLQAAVTPPGDGAPALTGPVTFMDNAVDPATGTIRLKATLENDGERLTPGQFVNVSLTIERLTGVVTVPAEAVQQGPKGTFIFVLAADDTATQRPVEASPIQDGIAVVRGLQAGETVVTDGHIRLTPGAKAKPVPRP